MKLTAGGPVPHIHSLSTRVAKCCVSLEGNIQQAFGGLLSPPDVARQRFDLAFTRARTSTQRVPRVPVCGGLRLFRPDIRQKGNPYTNRNTTSVVTALYHPF